jgi:hypothetical protein
VDDWVRLGGRLTDLTVAECWQLLADSDVGRVAWCDAGGPVILPVNYVIHDHAVWIRTSPYSLLARECDGSRAAFQLDGIDEFTESGWSVLVRGKAAVHSAHDLPPGLPELTSWAAGLRAAYVEVQGEEVTGRRLLAT